MRIITGKYKGRVIRMPKGIRPTQDKVRKALFDILGDIKGLSFLELFAGSGAVGLEALSQGAKEVVFVEKDSACIKLIEENLNRLEFQTTSLRFSFEPATGNLRPMAMLMNKDTQDAIKALHKDKSKFDIIVLDPPYYKDLAKKTLKILEAYDILAPNGLIAVQHFKKDTLPKESGQLILIKEARYGDTKLSFYRKVNPKS